MTQKQIKAIPITLMEAPELLKDVMEGGHVPYLRSSPGIGKSSVAKQIAKEWNLCFIDLRLAGADPTDLNGFPAFVDNRARYMPFEEFPVEGTELPWKVKPSEDGKVKGVKYDGWFILLDELSSAPKGVQAAAYKLILDRMVGSHVLDDRVAMMAAGNLETDGAIVNKLSTALQTRMVHFLLEHSDAAFLEYAAKENWCHRILGFLNFRKCNIYRFDPQHNDLTYPCGRSWEFMNDITGGMPEITQKKLPLLTGTVGLTVGTEFLHYCNIFVNQLPPIDDILNDQSCVHIDDKTEANVLFAIVGIIQSHLNAKTAPNLMKLLNRIPRKEMQVTCLIGVIKHKPDVMDSPAVLDWVTRNHTEVSNVMDDV